MRTELRRRSCGLLIGSCLVLSFVAGFGRDAAAQNQADNDLQFQFGGTAGEKGIVSPRLQEFARIERLATARGVAMPRPPARYPFMIDPMDRIAVRLVATNIVAIRAPLAAIGFVEMGARENIGLIEGFIPINQLHALDGLAAFGLKSASPVWRPITNAGVVPNQADLVHSASRVRAALPVGYDGTGVKIGVLSDSYNALGGAQDGIASGDLPAAGVQVLQDIPFGSDEGRGMLELIHDLAPGSQLAFATAFTSETGFANNIIALKNAGCKVIVDDVRYFDEPYYQDGIVAQAVDTVKAAGVCYFSSAGNQASQSYESPVYRETDLSAAVDGITIRWFDFSVGGAADARQLVTLQPGEFIRVALQWDDPFYSNLDTDLDLFVVEAGGTSSVESSRERNIGTQLAFEYVVVSNETAAPKQYEIMIQRFEGPPPSRIKFINYGSKIDIGAWEYFTSSPTCTGHAAARGAMGVGAAPYFDHTNPESFTSTGPAVILFNESGVPLGSPQIRPKPDISAVDGTNTTFFPPSPGQDYEPDGRPNFFGTSAAAPHAAAVAALLLQKEPGLTPDQVYDRLRNTADDEIGGAGFDDQTGAGLIDAFRALFGVPDPAGFPFVEDFESGFLGHMWETRTTVNGRIQVTGLNNPAIEARHLTMDTFFQGLPPRNTFSLNELVLHFDAPPAEPIRLSFFQREFGTSNAPMPPSFVGSDNSSGVALSVDGTNWYRIVSLVSPASSNVNQLNQFDLRAIALANGLTLGSDVQIKFQQFFNAQIVIGGFAWDQIQLYNPTVPPAFVQQPLAQQACIGETVKLRVQNAGAGPIGYQWFQGATPLSDGGAFSGANTNELTISPFSAAAAGQYRVQATNIGGTSASDTVAVSVRAAVQIAVQPSSTAVCIGDPLTLQVDASGAAPVTYQWRRNGTEIPGATSPSIAVGSVSFGDAGQYTVVVANACGAVISNAATVSVASLQVCDPTTGFLGCPGDVQLTATSAAGAALAFALPRVDPASAQVELTSTHQPGTVFPVGSTVVTFTARDLVRGTTRTCSFTVTVLAGATSPTGGTTNPPGTVGGVPVAAATCCTAGMVDALMLGVSTMLLTLWPQIRRRRRR